LVMVNMWCFRVGAAGECTSAAAARCERPIVGWGVNDRGHGALWYAEAAFLRTE
jgi:hypothetical protein